LEHLHFDLMNPRYGRRAETVKSETQALDLIVSDFLVDDLLSSISVNGFFDGEPLIARERSKDDYVVMEGNRRLASLLILLGDKRAAGQLKRQTIFGSKLKEYGTTLPTTVPVIVLGKGEKQAPLLAYLGTKHIVGPSEWDSYAKAKWMAQMKADSGLTLQQIKEMIGDVSGLVDRMLEGYYVVEQTRDSGRFDAGQSYVKGRGSNPEFPFSWIYTAISLSGIRRFIGIGDKAAPAPDPIPKSHIQDAGDLFEMMFGNRMSEKKPVIKESRDLSDLAKALTDKHKSAKLRQGVPLEIVEDEGRPLAERLSLLIGEAKDRLTKANGVISQGGVEQEEATELEKPANQTFQAAKKLRNELRRIFVVEEDDDD
jgi:hypothetical protein